MPSKKDTVTSVWASDLTWAALPVLLGIFRRHGRFTLRFTAASRSGHLISWLLRVARLLTSPAQHVEFTGHGERVDDVESAYFHIYAKTNQLTEQLFHKYRPIVEGIAYPDRRVRRDRVLVNVRKAAALELYSLLAFFEFVRYWHRVHGVPTGPLVILPPAAVLANGLPNNWVREGVEFHCPLNMRHSLFLRLGRAILTCLTQCVRRRRQAPAQSHRVALEFLRGFDRSERVNDLFWWWSSGIPSERVLLFFDRADFPADSKIVAQAEQLGISCVALDRRASGDSPHLLWHPAPGPVASLRRLWREFKVFGWGVRRGCVGRWAACRSMDMLHKSARIEDFLTEFDVKGLFHYQDSGVDYASLACDGARSARIGFHWSSMQWPVAYQARLDQVTFTWGRQYADLLAEGESSVDYVLQSGCIVRGASPNGCGGEAGARNRQLVARNGAERVLVLFDTSLPCERFYEFFLQKVVHDARWGLLIKPKYANYLPWQRWPLPEIQALYEQAVATGRVQLLDNRLSPAEAAAAADFAVGVDINSAAVVAALAGHRAIHLDYPRLHASPFAEYANFYRAGPDRLVFDDPEKLWENLNRFFDEPGFNPSLGLADEELLREIDHFRDGKAGDRIGDYVRWYLEGFDIGLDRDQALEAATCRYTAKWGEDSVVKRPNPVADVGRPRSAANEN